MTTRRKAPMEGERWNRDSISLQGFKKSFDLKEYYEVTIAQGRAIDAESRREELDAILEQYNLGPENLELVDGFPNEPMRVSKCQKILKKIYIKKSITPEEKQAVLAEVLRFGEDISALEDDWMFLKHTMLKHVCSIQQRWQPDYECSKWALYNMKRV